MTTALALKETLDEIIAKRERALELYTSGLKMINEAMKIHKEAAKTDHLRGMSTIFDRHLYYDLSQGCMDRRIQKIRSFVDADLWRRVHEFSGIRDLMDSEATDGFEEQLETDCPEFTVDNVLATFQDLYADKEKIFARGVVNVFRNLSSQYARHDSFKITNKLIIKHLGGYGRCRDRYGLNDLDRMCHIIEGNKIPEANELLGNKLEFGKMSNDFETEFFNVKIYMNGNVHLKFSNPEIVNSLNRILAKYFGEVLASGGKRSPNI